MANSETFSSDFTVTIGNPTKSSDAATLANNTDYLEEALAKVLVPADADGRIIQSLTEAAAAATKVMIDSKWDPASGTAQANQAIRWRVQMDDDAGTPNQTVVGALDWVMTDVLNTSEDLRLDVYVITNAVLTNVLALSGSLLDIKAGVIIEANNAIRWDTGVAVVAAAYQTGRDADGTNQLHFNVPTGATFEWSVNDVGQATLTDGAISPVTDSDVDLGTSLLRYKVVYLDTLGDSGQQLALNSSSVRAANVPCFLATQTGTLTNITGSTLQATISFNSEIFDQGANFSSTTFTAPVTGRYLLATSISWGGQVDASSIALSIVTSNRTYRIFYWSGSTTAGNQEEGGTVVADMDAADTATILLVLQGEAGGDIIDVDQSWFSGVMVA